MRNKNLTAAAAMATATALMLAGCATQKPAASSSEAASTAPAESSVVEETTPEEAPSEVTDVDEAAAEDLLLSTETMHYSADDEDGVVTVHKYDENGNEVFMREIDKASDMDTVIIKELDENGNVVLGDEMLTPDSSRFWPLEGYEAGHGQPSFDKQFVRNWLKANPDSNYDLPQDVIDKTIEKYLEAYEMLTGKKL